MRYGYARVSTDHQDYTGQVAALKAAGCEKIVAEKITGASLDRRALVGLIARLAPGDHLIATRMDRLARSLRDLLNITAKIEEAGATFEILDSPLVNTSGPYGKFLRAILGAVGEFERSMILARTGEGRARAKLAGVRFGRKPSLTSDQQAYARKLRASGSSTVEIARLLGVSHSTISRSTSNDQ